MWVVEVWERSEYEGSSRDGKKAWAGMVVETAMVTLGQGI